MSNLTLENVENKIAAIIEDPQGHYTVGGVSFTWARYYEWLSGLRKDLIDREAQDADVSIMSFDIDVNEFGEDNSQVQR